MSDAIKVLKFWVKIFPDVEDKEVCKEAILALENQKDCFVCDVCGRETASCLTLCPSCNNKKQGALEELRNVWDRIGVFSENGENEVLLYVNKRIKELEGVEKHE